jgi:peptidoglycan LD-endopeptidase LytH
MKKIVVLLAIIFAAFFIYNNSEAVPEAVKETTAEVGLPFKLAQLAMREPEARILMPVEGVKVKSVSNTWQAPRGDERQHEGQDIFAKRGTPVYSATDGYIVRIGENNLGGNIVFVAGAGGRYYYYAHLDRFSENLRVGDYVTTETVIGYVGNTGNARTTPPHLHFGVYTSGGSINPLPLLADR